MLKAIVFDYNGTLADDLDLAVESYFRAGNERGYRLAREKVREHISQPPSAKRRLYFGDIPDAEWAAIIERRKQLYAEMAQTAFRLFPQTERALTALARRYRLGVLSNTFRSLYEQLFPAHLARLLPASLFFDEVPDPKPSPAPMLAMLRTDEGAGRRMRLRRRCGRGRADGKGRRGALVCARHRDVQPAGAARGRRRLGGRGPGRPDRVPHARGWLGNTRLRKSLTDPRAFD